MKIGIITFHFASNQGAVLQCYALQHYLEKEGHNVRVIDYRPVYHTVRYTAKKDPFIYARGFWKKFNYKKTSRRIFLTARSFVRCLYMNIRQVDNSVEQLYEDFRKIHLHLTKEYKSLKQLKKTPPIMDAYITGSDQLWNPEVLDQKFDEAYFLTFGSKETIRISYAVSIGKEMPEEFLGKIRELCKNIDAISLREYNRSVVEAIGKDVHICIDPTFLLEEEDYKKVEEPVDIKEPYIFIYGFESNDNIFAAIEEAKDKYKCRIVNGSPMRIKYRGEAHNVREYGPGQFLSYIKNAACVVTNSFHATTFSIIYKKSFITIPHSMRGMRMKNLLGRLDLCSCLYGDSAFDINAEIDYSRIHMEISKWRHQSELFLTMALSGKRGEDIPHPKEENYVFEN